ncbi:hypothetical protein CFN78_08020 [Amycolatopsis antarctica]|uniref:SAF domain-containing protein n=1 Tax=Amycolatopsis antarctica TaxID=1854586 RepID=A0A263D622_9PSEU|nr:SAF domain-containing protein [Amycolatopsis antarctica]OZM73488.1 hypothetical protein CFN78_08020 [Amycolatopsis antarctica]
MGGFGVACGRRWQALRARSRSHGRLILRLRRGLAVALLLGAAALAMRPGVSAGEATVPVLVAAADLPQGTTLGAEHVRVARMPESLRPGGAYTEPGTVDGRLLAGATRTGEPLTDVRVVGTHGDLAGLGGPDRATVPIRLADAGVAEFLHPGSTVDIVAPQTPEQQRRVLAEGAVIITVVDDSGERKPGGNPRGPMVLVSVPEAAAAQVAGVSLTDSLAVTLR